MTPIRSLLALLAAALVAASPAAAIAIPAPDTTNGDLAIEVPVANETVAVPLPTDNPVVSDAVENATGLVDVCLQRVLGAEQRLDELLATIDAEWRAFHAQYRAAQEAQPAYRMTYEAGTQDEWQRHAYELQQSQRERMAAEVEAMAPQCLGIETGIEHVDQFSTAGFDLARWASQDSFLTSLYAQYFDLKHDLMDPTPVPEGPLRDLFGNVSMMVDEEAGRLVAEGNNMRVEAHPGSHAITQFTCAGHAWVEDIRYDGSPDSSMMAETAGDRAFQALDLVAGIAIGIYDDPRCTMQIATTAASARVHLDLDDALDCAVVGDGDVWCSDGEGSRIDVLVHDGDAIVSPGNDIAIAGLATVLLADGHLTPRAEALGAIYSDALLEGRIGAEALVAQAADGLLAAQVVPIGDLQMQVAGEADRLVATVESAAGDGRTVLLEVDPAMFSTDALTLDAWAIADNGSVAVAAVHAAESLEDVLHPDDDGEVIEHWKIKTNGRWFVLVSFPHFSAKRIELRPATADEMQGSPEMEAPGLAPLLALAAVGTAAMLRRRRA